ncbi:MAG: leucine-rich repeat domain-containing protein [Verrucomicrobiota bacterium]|nr:leucine-rich repeat domain-containing protein [Verrucomicrobiota bacterium]
MKNLSLWLGWMVLGFSAMIGDAQAAVFGDFVYTIYNDEFLTIVGYNGPGGIVEIPSEIDGQPVSRIDGRNNHAFFQNQTLTGVVIPGSVFEIDNCAFSGCSNLESVTFSPGLLQIGYEAFKDCTSLSSVHIPEGVTLIAGRAFYNCTSLVELSLPNSLLSILPNAFAKCASLTDLSLPEGLKWINGWAFSECDALTEVTIPQSLDSYLSAVFVNSANLLSINVHPLNPNYASIDGVVFSKDLTRIIECPGGKTGSYVIPDTVTEIRSFAFRGCHNLTDLSLPAGVNNIGASNFDGATSLTAFHVDPENPHFEDVDGVLFTEDLSVLFSYPGGLSGDYVIPATVREIAHLGFSDCTKLTGVTIPDSVVSICSFAFGGCESLTSLVLPDGLSYLGASAFKGCSGLLEMEIPSGITGISSSTFSGCTSLRGVTLPDSVEIIGMEAFLNCVSLEYLTLPAGLVFIEENAFSGCSSLTSLTIPAAVAEIEIGAFQDCPTLESLYFEGNMPEHEPPLFEGTNTTVYFVEGKTGWSDAFAGMPTVKQLVPLWIGDFIMVEEGARLTIHGAPKTEVVIEASGNPASGVWGAIGNFTLENNGEGTYTDTMVKKLGIRFYRVRRK